MLYGVWSVCSGNFVRRQASSCSTLKLADPTAADFAGLEQLLASLRLFLDGLRDGPVDWYRSMHSTPRRLKAGSHSESTCSRVAAGISEMLSSPIRIW